MQHHVSYRVYFEDTDAGGVMYHGNYIAFCERARTELLLDTGYTNRDLKDDVGILFVVRHMDVNYLKPLLLEDKVDIYTSLHHIKNSSLIFKHIIKKDDVIVFENDVTLVCVDAKTVRPVKIPEDIKSRFSDYTE
ncbi:MAG: hypothetical protein CL570_01840 [Alphaproteobacteria bacterium]|nr:hypothetical protein [Alphaproteobacteria bacterium]HCQ71489.1 hypothetical protein [Rhodospirillaceae bacterium]|tara:strand:- start:36757 stop:37161 length:405 start_codon:yes stop_codon:yes gene_type:complete